MIGIEKLEWSDGLALGPEPLDAAHRTQVELVGALEDALRTKRDKRATDRLLEQLRSYTKDHFLGEELLMQLLGCPDYEPHVREHAKLLGELERLTALYARDDLKSTLGNALALRDWLDKHFLTMDCVFARHLTGARSEPA